MTHKILSALAVATLLVPSLAQAMPTLDTPVRSALGMPQPQHMTVPIHPTPVSSFDTGTLGNGHNGKDVGDVTGPGTKVRPDPSVKGPMDDVNPGNPHSDDVLQSAHPEPVPGPTQ